MESFGSGMSSSQSVRGVGARIAEAQERRAAHHRAVFFVLAAVLPLAAAFGAGLGYGWLLWNSDPATGSAETATESATMSASTASDVVEGTTPAPPRAEKLPSPREIAAARSAAESPVAAPVETVRNQAPSEAVPIAAPRSVAESPEEERRQDQEFLRAIAEGWKALDDRKLATAKEALDRAARRKPEHGETRRLKERVAALERAETLDRYLADAQRAGARDDWAASLDAYEKVRALEPAHGKALQGREIASRILNTQREIDRFLARPERLGTPAVVEAARKTLTESLLLALSPRLRKSAEELERVIEVRQTPVPVRVLSDNRTVIGVRGVGMIGRTEDRIVKLRPGTYVFEGKRKGYRSKLIEVTVSPGVPSEDVRVICDERT